MQKTWVPSPGSEDPLEEEMATHSSILAWRIPWTEEPGGLQSKGSQKSQTWLSNWIATTKYDEVQYQEPSYYCFKHQPECTGNNLLSIWTTLSAGQVLHALSCFSVVQFSSVTQSCPTLCNPMNLSTPGLPVNHQLPEFTQTHVHRVSDAIQASHPPLSPSPPAPNPSQHQSLFQWVNSSHEVAKVLDFQL